MKNPYFDSAGSVLIGLVPSASAGLLARKCVSMLVGASLNRDPIGQLRKILVADPAVESLGHLLAMPLGTDGFLLTTAFRFQRRLTLDEVDQAVERLERAIKVAYPAMLRPLTWSRAHSRGQRIRLDW